jgi:hypothetical protein
MLINDTQKVSCCVSSSKIGFQIIKNIYRCASVMNPDVKSLYKSAYVCVCVCGGGGGRGMTLHYNVHQAHTTVKMLESCHCMARKDHTMMEIPWHKTSSWSPSNLCLQVLDCFRMTHVFMQNWKPRCFTSHKIVHRMSILQYFCDLIITHIWTKQLSVVYCKGKNSRKTIIRLNWPDQENNLNLAPSIY